MFELRWAVDPTTTRPAVLQFRKVVKHIHGHEPDKWGQWSDVPTVAVAPNAEGSNGHQTPATESKTT